MANQLYRKSFTLPNGKRKWVSAATEEDLERKLLDLRMEANLGIDVTNNITFGEYALRWYRVCKEPNIKTNAKNSVLNSLNNHILPYLSGIPIRSITQIQIQYVFNQLAGKSNSLNGKVKTVLNAIFKNAIANHVIQNSPMVEIELSGKKPKKKKALTEAQEAFLLSNLAKGKDAIHRRDYLFTLMGFKTGMRRGELCGLMLSDFDLINKTVKVNRSVIWPDNNQAQISDTDTETKTETAIRTIPIPDTIYLTVCEAIREAASQGFLYLFHLEDGNMLSMTALCRMWERVQKASPVKFTMHEMRHTYCSRLIRKSVSLSAVQYLMGHKDPGMTLRIYNHFLAEEQLESESARVRACL